MKLVKERLHEVSIGKGPVMSSIGVGKVTYIKKWLDEMDVKRYRINEDMTIDVDGDVDLSTKVKEQLPEFVQFNVIYGNFYIDDCDLFHLRGCPTKVLKSFTCSNNSLSSLEFCPKEVGGDFVCYDNKHVNFTQNDVRGRCRVGKRAYFDEDEYFSSSGIWDRAMS